MTSNLGSDPWGQTPRCEVRPTPAPGSSTWSDTSDVGWRASAHAARNRGEHDPPAKLSAPPADWAVSYRRFAEAVGIAPSLDTGHTAAARCLDPVLDGTITHGAWIPETRRWDAESQ